MSNKLDDPSQILLSAAHARDDGAMLPAPDGFEEHVARASKIFSALIRRKLAVRDGDQLYITPAGRAAIDEALPPLPASPESNSPQGSKTNLLITLIQNESGASLAEIVAATGWLPHTTRAAISGLRKKGHVIILVTSEQGARYRISQN